MKITLNKHWHEILIVIKTWHIVITTHLYSTIETEMVRNERVYSILPFVFIYQTQDMEEFI